MTATRKQAEKKGEVEARPSGRDPIGDWLDVLESMLGVPAARRRAIRQELEDHLRSRVDDLTITGLSEPEAVRAAVGELGETADLAKRFREAASVNRRRLWMHAAMFGLVGGAIAIGTVGVTGGLNTSGPAAVAGAAGGAVSAEPADEYGGMQRYSVHGLVLSDAPLEATAAGDRLVDTIVDLVQPAEWEEFGGESRIKLLGNTLFVSAPAEVREGVEWVLASLEEDAERIRAERERRAEEVVESRRAVVEGRIEELNAELERLLGELGDLAERSSANQMRMRDNLTPFNPPNMTQEQREERDRMNLELSRNSQLIDAERELLNERIARVREVLLDLQYGVPGRPDLSGSTMAMPDAALPTAGDAAHSADSKLDEPFVYVAGTVAKRGKYPLPEGKLGLFELVSQLDIRQRGAFVQVSRPDGSPKIMQMSVAAILDGVPAKESLQQGDVVRVIVPEATEAEPKTVRFRSLDGEERSFIIGDGGVRTVADVLREVDLPTEAPTGILLRLVYPQASGGQRVGAVYPLESVLGSYVSQLETGSVTPGTIIELVPRP